MCERMPCSAFCSTLVGAAVFLVGAEVGETVARVGVWVCPVGVTGALEGDCVARVGCFDGASEGVPVGVSVVTVGVWLIGEEVLVVGAAVVGLRVGLCV